VLIGADADASISNLTAAINGSGTEGVNYSVDTEQPTDVVAVVDTDANTVTCTASTRVRSATLMQKPQMMPTLIGMELVVTSRVGLTELPHNSEKTYLDSDNGVLWMAFGTCTISDTDKWFSFSKDEE
jgi:hypothetical protein